MYAIIESFSNDRRCVQLTNGLYITTTTNITVCNSIDGLLKEFVNIFNVYKKAMVSEIKNITSDSFICGISFTVSTYDGDNSDIPLGVNIRVKEIEESVPAFIEQEIANVRSPMFRNASRGADFGRSLPCSVFLCGILFVPPKVACLQRFCGRDVLLKSISHGKSLLSYVTTVT